MDDVVARSPHRHHDTASSRSLRAASVVPWTPSTGGIGERPVPYLRRPVAAVAVLIARPARARLALSPTPY